MLDDLREQAGNIDYFEEEDSDDTFNYADSEAPKKANIFLGMTAPQRFVIATMLMLMVCVLGSFALLVTEKIYLPFF